MTVSQELDQLCDEIKREIPDADLIEAGRMRMEMNGPPHYDWRIRFHLPRRGKKHQVLRGTEVLAAEGQSFDEALEKAKIHAHYHRTGKLPAE